jgi:hypothetical protein
MKTQPGDEIMAEVHAVKDALSQAAGYDVVRLIAASRQRSQSKESKPVSTLLKKRASQVRRRKAVKHPV